MNGRMGGMLGIGDFRFGEIGGVLGARVGGDGVEGSKDGLRS